MSDECHKEWISGSKNVLSYENWERPSDLIKSPTKNEKELPSTNQSEEINISGKMQNLLVDRSSKAKRKETSTATLGKKGYVDHSDFWGITPDTPKANCWEASPSKEVAAPVVIKEEEEVTEEPVVVRTQPVPVFTKPRIDPPETQVPSCSNGFNFNKNYDDFWNSQPAEIDEEPDEKTLQAKRFLESTNNVFTPFYQGGDKKRKKERGIMETGIGKELRRYRHTDAVEFAATSWCWTNNSERNLPPFPRHKTLSLPAFASEDGTFAFYRVISDKYDKYILIACHVNVHAYHRGDLRFIEVNDRTVLKGLERKSVMGNLFLGDVLAVTKLALKSGGPLIGSPVSNVSHESKCTWMAHKMTLLTRNKPANVIFSFLNNGAAVVKGFDEAMAVLDADPLNVMSDVLYAGQAFVPQKIAVSYASDFNAAHKNALTLKVLKIVTYPNASGTIYTYHPSEVSNEMFGVGVKAFCAETPAPSDAYREKVVETCVIMGYSAANTIFNGRFDCRVFPLENGRRDGQIVRFSIENPEEQPTEGRWNSNNRITFGGPIGDISAVIETAVTDGDRLNIVARIPRGIPNIATFDDGYVVSQREPVDSNSLRDGFFTNLNSKSNGKRVITTLYGGPPVPLNNPIEPIHCVFPGHPPTHLNEFQNEYVFMMLDRNPLVLGSSPFGCGKSVTIVTAALEIHKLNQKESVIRKQKQQLLITQSNYASVNLVDIISKVDELDVDCVRFVSEKNWREMPDNCRTEFDMPHLMERLFTSWAIGVECGREKRLCHNHMTNMLHYLFDKNLLLPNDTVGKARDVLDRMGELKRKPFVRELVDAFFILYQPDIIVVTADSSQSLLNAFVLTEVTTIQIDEASQVPEYTFLNLLALFPDACFGLIGDIHQLPPYCEDELDGRLKEYGIGNTMERALHENMFPKSVLRYVYRCHPVTTGILSELFYDGELISGVGESQRNEFITRRSDIWPNAKFPICVLDNKEDGTKMGTSLINRVEKDLVVRLVSLLTQYHDGYQLRAADIGVISFYAAQTNILTEALRGSGIKCGTVDAFQGTEREVIVLCCTNERLSDFMQLPNRLNVALSRSRQATIIIGNVNGLRKARFWSQIVQKVEENGCVVDAASDSAIFGT